MTFDVPLTKFVYAFLIELKLIFSALFRLETSWIHDIMFCRDYAT